MFEIPDSFMMQLFLNPDCFKTQGICIKAAEEGLSNLGHVPNCLKTQEMCSEAARIKPFFLVYVPDHLKTHEICSEVLEKNS